MAEKQRYAVLVVDDTEANVDILVDILESDYDISVALDGPGALEIVESGVPYLILLDAKMPVMHGLEALKKIRELDSNAVVVMLTNEADKDTVMNLLQAGAQGYLLKPIQRKAVLVKLAEVRPKTAKKAKRPEIFFLSILD